MAGARYADVERSEILGRLDRVEAEEGVSILLAVESGSRAWGFASTDSDWDIRFVSAWPVEGYVTIRERRDVIERPIDERGIDLSGWDLKKALGLLLASNPALLEWLNSPITYRDDDRFRPNAKALFEQYASRRALAHHYRSIARTHWDRSLAGDGPVKLKRYFYVVRSAAALDWVVSGRDLPPMNLHELVAGSDLPAEARADLDDLLALKTTMTELGEGPRRAGLDRYILDVLDRADPGRIDDRAERRRAFEAEADALFRRLIGLG